MAEQSNVDIIDFTGMQTAVVRGKDVPTSQIREFMDTAFAALHRVTEVDVQVKPIGPAFSRYDSEYGEKVDVEVGVPVEEPLGATIQSDGVEIVPSELPAGRIATTKYVGEYDGLGQAWGDFLEAVKADGHQLGLPYWEAYDTPPVEGETPVTGLAIRIGEQA